MMMRLTERDLILLRWINNFGFVTVDVVTAYLKISRPVAWRRLRKLKTSHYVLYERVFQGMPGSYRVTLLGAQASGSELPPLRSLSPATYRHDLTVVTLSLCLIDRWGGDYIPERLLRHEQMEEGVGQVGHFCDGVLQLQNRRIAIEVELHKKGKHRRQKILQSYLKNFEYQSVWYFCGNTEIENQLKSFTDTFPFLEVYSLSDYVSIQGIKEGDKK